MSSKLKIREEETIQDIGGLPILKTKKMATISKVNQLITTAQTGIRNLSLLICQQKTDKKQSSKLQKRLMW